MSFQRGCSSELAWYKSVKETQGSIQETTFGQMNNILAYGCYVIGSQRPQIFQSIHDIICVILTERDQPLTKKQYSLNELRDLESKLALIVGKSAKNNSDVNDFILTLHNVCRIAEVLISLQQVGNVRYTGWRLCVPCGLGETVVHNLQNLAKSMELELKSWEEHVIQKRGDFYELNYFTTLQLLTLRRELRKIKSQSHSSSELCNMAPCVLSLLESISTQVTSPSSLADSIRSVSTSLASSALVTQSGVLSATPVSSSAILDESSTKTVKLQPKIPSLAQELFKLADVQTFSGAKEMKLDFELPKISEDQLTEKQKGIMEDVTIRYGFNKNIVLKAFEECEDQTKYGIEKWCNDNAGNYALPEDDLQSEHFIEEDDNMSDTSHSTVEYDDELYSSSHQQPLEQQLETTPLSFSGIH